MLNKSESHLVMISRTKKPNLQTAAASLNSYPKGCELPVRTEES
jgi:hypothetical protein